VIILTAVQPLVDNISTDVARRAVVHQDMYEVSDYETAFFLQYSTILTVLNGTWHAGL